MATNQNKKKESVKVTTINLAEEDKAKSAKEKYQAAITAQGINKVTVELAKEKLRNILTSKTFNDFLDKSSKIIERV